jgi:hypothetical protein
MPRNRVTTTIRIWSHPPWWLSLFDLQDELELEEAQHDVTLHWVRTTRGRNRTIALLGRHPLRARAAHLQPSDCCVKPRDHLPAAHLLACPQSGIDSCPELSSTCHRVSVLNNVSTWNMVLNPLLPPEECAES